MTVDNPAFFTVLAADDDGLSLTDAGILGSRRAAETEAARRRALFPGLRHEAAVITLLDQDPISGTPLNHLAPVSPAGFALASLTVPDSSRRKFAPGCVYSDFNAAHAAAQAARERNRACGNDYVRDLIALTLLKEED
jgi:hypothetical protein